MLAGVAIRLICSSDQMLTPIHLGCLLTSQLGKRCNCVAQKKASSLAYIDTCQQNFGTTSAVHRRNDKERKGCGNSSIQMAT